MSDDKARRWAFSRYDAEFVVAADYDALRARVAELEKERDEAREKWRHYADETRALEHGEAEYKARVAEMKAELDRLRAERDALRPQRRLRRRRNNE